MLVCGVNGALTRADENEVGEQQLTPHAPLNCKAAARRSKPLEREGGKEIERRKRHISITLGQHEDGPRCWRAVREKFCCSPPRSPAGLRALRHAVGHGHRDFFHAVDARVRCLTTWRTCHPLLRCCGRQWCPHGSCERRDDKIEARQNQSSDCISHEITGDLISNMDFFTIRSEYLIVNTISFSRLGTI